MPCGLGSMATRAGSQWAQEDPNYRWFTPFGEPKRLITRNGSGSGDAAARVIASAGTSRGLLEGFANIYSEAAEAIIAHRAGNAPAAGGHVPHG